MAWVASQQNPINTTISDIGSPDTNVTVSITNDNSPMITQDCMVTVDQMNTNNDMDIIDSNSMNTDNNMNINNGRKWPDKILK